MLKFRRFNLPEISKKKVKKRRDSKILQKLSTSLEPNPPLEIGSKSKIIPNLLRPARKFGIIVCE